MAIFQVLNGTGINGNGIQFGSMFAQINASGIAGFPIITPTTGSIFYNDTGLFSIGGVGMSFVFPSTFGGTVTSLSYSRPAVTPVFTISGISEPLSEVAGLLTGGGDELSFLADLFSGDDTIGGSALNDFLMGFAGADTLNGGDGIDTASYIGSATAVVVNLLTGVNMGGDAQGDTLTGIENVAGSSFDDILTGDGNANRLDGNDGADALNGGAGSDTLDGSTGADAMAGGAGADTYLVDNLGDVVDESGGNAGEIDRVFSSVSVDLSDTSHFTGQIEAVQLTGSATSVTGNDLRNYLIGNQEANLIDGGSRADVMWGRAGNDTYIVDNVGDVVDESIYAGTGIDTVVSSVGFNLGSPSQARGALENLTLTGSANANAVGNSLANIIIGNDGANIIAGGLRNDTLTGGGANDVFFFNTAPGAGNVDTITDMNETGNDSIWLDDAIFTALTAGPLAAAAFVISSLGAVDADDRIVYNSVNGQLSYDADGNGAGASTLFANLDLGLALTASDFVVV